MSFEVHCEKCGARFTLTDDLYERKVRGRVVSVRCRKCRADITVDGSELTSHPPAAVELTPTVPLSGIGSGGIGGLWVVSFGEEDDRELTLSQIKKALEDGQIDADTLVWNTSMDEWLPVSEVRELEVALPGASSGGFLGTGVSISEGGREAPDDGAKNPVGDSEVGPFKSVAAGTLYVEAEAKGKSPASSREERSPETPRSVAAEASSPEASSPEASSPEASSPDTTGKRKKKKKKKKGASISAPAMPSTELTPLATELKADADRAAREPEPRVPVPDAEPKQEQPALQKRLPTVPPKVRPDWLAEKEQATPPPPEDEELPPSSKTPALTQLTSFLAPKSEAPDSGPTSADEIYAIGGSAITTALAPVDLSKIPDDEPPPSSTMAVEPDDIVESEAPARKAPAKPKKRDRDLSDGPPSVRRKQKRPQAPSTRTKPAVAARPAEEVKSGSSLGWWLLGGVALLAAAWIFLRDPSTSDEPRPTPTTSPADTPTAPGPTAEPTAAPPPPETAQPEATKPETTKPETTKPETTKPETTKPETTEPETTKPETAKPDAGAAPPPDTSTAPPFDANAAKAALASAAASAAGCRQEGDPTGTATVIVTFAPSGRVTTANVAGPPFAGTKTGGCIAARMRSATVPAFSGAHVTVSKTITIQ